ncbi:hypothetical protein [Acinetobacter venetianus]|uniref:NinB family protein n=1 Tax=Acinetobacter venetianus TaxID=52133 RepID=A0A150HY76_9GAMM|nr:hypothetical protein [Acinetobacter venetianus]KXZ72156.1 hypothetical protein AVENLUH13518_00767 [Acinetobacter venetianus]
MKTAVFTIKDHSDIGKTINYLHNNYTQANFEGKPLVVTIKPKETKRSNDQNALYWLWMTKWANHTGQTKDEASAHFKYVCLAKIFERDRVGEYPNTFAALRALKAEQNPSYEQLRKFVAQEISTTHANTKQFTEYLNDIHDWSMVNSNFYLEKPEDLMYVLESKE